MQFYVGQINISIKNNNNVSILYNNIICNIYKSKNIFIIFSDHSLKPLIQIKNPIYIKDSANNFVIKNNKNEFFLIDIIKSFVENSYNGKYSAITNTITKKEENIKMKIINNFHLLFPELKMIQSEYITPYGNIDILAIDNNKNYHIFELKKNKTTLDSINQVEKYGEYFEDLGKGIYLYNITNKSNKKEKEYAYNKDVKLINYNELSI